MKSVFREIDDKFTLVNGEEGYIWTAAPTPDPDPEWRLAIFQDSINGPLFYFPKHAVRLPIEEVEGCLWFKAVAPPVDGWDPCDSYIVMEDSQGRVTMGPISRADSNLREAISNWLESVAVPESAE